MASAPIIIPILCLIIIIVFIILSIYRIMTKLFGCPNKKSTYLFTEIDQKHHHHRSVLPQSNPYTIDPSIINNNNNDTDISSSTGSPNSIYYKNGLLLYPALTTTTTTTASASATAPSRSPSPRNDHMDDLKDEIIDLDNVDTQILNDKIVNEDEDQMINHHLLTIHSTDSSSPKHFINNDNDNTINQNNNDNDQFESDV